MRKNLKKYRNWCSVFCTILLIGSSLLSGCTSQPAKQGQTQPTGTTKTTEVLEQTQTDNTEPSANTSDDSSLVIFRQAMTETPQLFAVAFFGYAPQESAGRAEPLQVLQKAAPRLCEDLPFLLTIDQDHSLGVKGQLFCIVPADENATVAVNRVKWNAETESYDCIDVIYRNESGDPILLMCNNSGQEPDTEIVITDSNGNVAVWYPHMDSSYSVAPLYDDNGERLLLDFTSYDELPDPGWNQEIDSSGLVGIWELTWTEVEGDRNQATPGICTVEIVSDETGVFRFTYSDKDFPDRNIQDRELLVIPGELYPGCGNGQWIGEVAEASGDTVRYALTLLEDGTLLIQDNFIVDGYPMVGYEWFVRIQ